MRVSADLGCLREAERLKNEFLHAPTTVRWQETYACTPIALELPDEGSQRLEMQCPVCGEGMLLKLASVERFRFLLICALGFITAVIFGLGFALINFTDGDEILRMAGLIAFGVGAVVFCGATIVNFMKAEHLARTGDVLDIVKDYVRERPMAPGFSGMRGHKLFNIRGT